MKKLLFYSYLLLSVSIFAQKSTYFPKGNWKKYQSLEEAGWSKEKLDIAKKYYDSIASCALIIVDKKGGVVAAWGEYEREFITHSVRKSFMSALIGIVVHKKHIDINKTLGELKIQSADPLNSTENTATVEHLLQARSGVYRPAAAEVPYMARTRPQKDSHKPGEFWYYNNWDFNVLGTILKQETGDDTFTFMLKELAIPLGMQDYTPRDGFFHSGFRNEYAFHPAYMMKMSARDMARFGLLYLNEGNWNGKQIIQKDWVKKSIKAHSNTLTGYESLKAKYGYLWWLYNEPTGKNFIYEAAGAGGHYISVFPNSDFVIVHRVNTYDRTRRMSYLEKIKLYELIFSAKIGSVKSNPSLVDLEPQKKNYTEISVSSSKLDKYAKTYDLGRRGDAVIEKQNDKLILKVNFLLFPELELIPVGKHLFRIDGFEELVKFSLNNNGMVTDIQLGEDSDQQKITGKVKE